MSTHVLILIIKNFSNDFLRPGTYHFWTYKACKAEEETLTEMKKGPSSVKKKKKLKKMSVELKK